MKKMPLAGDWKKDENKVLTKETKVPFGKVKGFVEYICEMFKE